MQFQSYKVSEQENGKRLDIILADLGKLSRNIAQRLIKNSKVRINNKFVLKTGTKVYLGDTISYIKEKEISTMNAAEKIPLKIIYEDNDLLVINKDAGYVSHPDNSGHKSGTILNGALAISKNATLIHRLDKDTSGVLLIAKTEKSKTKYSKLFQDRKVKKTYYALVRGIPRSTKGRIDAPVKRGVKNRKTMAISTQGKNAISTFEVIEVFKNCTLLKVNIETGRTHQIRVHLASIGHPIVGDITYGDKKLNDLFYKKYGLKRQFLHAGEVEIASHTFKAPMPKDIKDVYDQLT